MTIELHYEKNPIALEWYKTHMRSIILYLNGTRYKWEVSYLNGTRYKIKHPSDES